MIFALKKVYSLEFFVSFRFKTKRKIISGLYNKVKPRLSSIEFILKIKIMNKYLSMLILLLIITTISCKKEDPEINCQDNIQIEIQSTTDAPCGTTSGVIEINPIPNIEFSIDGVNFSESGTFQNLGPGIFTITAMDQDGCMETKKVTVFSGISLVSDVMPVIETTCAISACHVSGEQSPNFSLKENVIANAPIVRNKLSEEAMPPNNSAGPELSTADRDKIICWIAEGALDN